MKTKETILETYAPVKVYDKGNVHAAMQEYADQQLNAYKEQLLAKLDAETERFEKMPHMMVERLIIKHIKTLIA